LTERQQYGGAKGARGDRNDERGGDVVGWNYAPVQEEKKIERIANFPVLAKRNSAKESH